MLLLTKEDIKKVYSMKDAIRYNKLAYQLTSEQKCAAPLRTQIPAPKQDGCFVFMPAYSEDMDAAAVKIVNVFNHNIEKGLPGSPAQVLLIDGTTGIVTAIMDGTYVTAVRTGAASGAAFDLLGRKDGITGALIGTGGQAASQLEAMLAARTLKKVRVYSRNQERVRAFTERMQKELESYGAEILPAASSDEAIEDADFIITATASRRPVFDGTKVKPGATVSCIGGYQPDMQELDPALLPRVSKIYLDSREAVLAEAGDLLIPLEQGIITVQDITGELGNVVNGTLVGRENDEEIIVFKSVGVATQDLIAAKAIYDKAVEIGAGTSWGE